MIIPLKKGFPYKAELNSSIKKNSVIQVGQKFYVIAHIDFFQYKGEEKYNIHAKEIEVSFIPPNPNLGDCEAQIDTFDVFMTISSKDSKTETVFPWSMAIQILIWGELPEGYNIKNVYPLEKWDKRFFELARFYSQWSKDPSTKCGAVIAKGNLQISQGFNGFPSGTSDSASLLDNREEKINRVLHAELNAILYAKRDLLGCAIYVYPFTPCSQCMAAIIQSGIKRVYTKEPTGELKTRWESSNKSAIKMAEEANVKIFYIDESESECHRL